MEHRLKKRKGTFFIKFIKLFITALLLPCYLSAQSPETSHLAYGIPGKADTIVERPGYALGYIERHEQAAWVIYIISNKQILAKNAERSNHSEEIRQYQPAVPAPLTIPGLDLTVDISPLPPTWHIPNKPCGTVFI